MYLKNKKGMNYMNDSKKEKCEDKIILLDKEDVKELTGWGTNTIDSVFALDENFPAIKIGKKYQVELSALKNYFSTRRTK